MTSADIFNTTLVLTMLGAVGFALLGGTAERRAAALLFGGLVATWSAQVFTDNAVAPLLVIDLSVALGFGALALMYPEKLWPGAAGSAQFFAFTFSASRALNFPLTDEAYLIANNLAGIGIVLAIVLGTYRARWCKPKLSEWDEFALKLDQLPPVRAT